MTNEFETVRQAYAALNRGDVPAFIALFDPEVERVEHFPSGTSCRGIDAFTAHVSQARATWAEGSCEPERLIAAGDNVVALVKVHVRLKHETERRDGQLADVFTFRNGRITKMHSFANRKRGLQWAGVDEENAN